MWSFSLCRPQPLASVYVLFCERVFSHQNVSAANDRPLSWRWESETNPRRSDRLQNGYVERVIGSIRPECTNH
jgi:hypothetical protein